MAASSVISRNACRPALLAFSTRTIGCSCRSFHVHGAISSIFLNNYNPKLHSSKSCNQSHHHNFSTAAYSTDHIVAKKLTDENLVRIIDSEMKTFLGRTIKKNIPEGFGFNVDFDYLEDDETHILKREISPNENIRVDVKTSYLGGVKKGNINGNGDGEDESDCFEDEDEDELNYYNILGLLPLVVRVSKSDINLTFKVGISTDEVGIVYMKINGSSQPNYYNLCSFLCDGLRRYLEVRGVNLILAELLTKTKVIMKEHKKILWLRKLKKCVYA